MAREASSSSGGGCGVPPPATLLRADAEDLFGAAVRVGAMSGEFYTTLSSGFTEDLHGSWSFVFFTDILRWLTDRQLDWLQNGI